MTKIRPVVGLPALTWLRAFEAAARTSSFTAANGAGCALAHRIFLSAYLATGRLVVALDHDFADDSSYFVVTPERPQRMRREVQLFRDWLLSAAAAGG